MQWLLSDIIFTKKLHAKCSWTFRTLVMTAVFWALSRETSLSERFSCAQRLTQHLDSSKTRATSQQAFLEMLRRHTDYLKEQLMQAFRRHMQSIAGHWKTYGFVLLGVDGTEVAVPRTQSNQSAFTTNGKSKHQKRTRIKAQNAHQRKLKECPRILMTTLFHITLGLPWAWKLGSKNTDERSQLLSMLNMLPKQSLIVGDAGFIGYQFLSEVMNSSAELIVRVGSNVKLLRKLGYARESDGIVYIWPDWAARKSCRPLEFRLVIVNNGRKPIYLITSVRSTKRLSDQQLAKIYSMRWGIEVYHRDLKQTMGHRKLLAHSPKNAVVELEWVVLGYTAMMLYSVDEMVHRDIDLKHLSTARVLLAFQQTARDYLHPVEHDATLDDKISQALKDTYKRSTSKESRNYPRRRKRKSPGIPAIVIANPSQRRLAKQIRKQSLAA